MFRPVKSCTFSVGLAGLDRKNEVKVTLLFSKFGKILLISHIYISKN